MTSVYRFAKRRRFGRGGERVEGISRIISKHYERLTHKGRRFALAAAHPRRACVGLEEGCRQRPDAFPGAARACVPAGAR